MKFVKILLFPVSLLYGMLVFWYHKLYDLGILPSRQFNVPVISVGNLTVGGTGKTPHVEYLIRLLHSYTIATLSRGYGRKTKGFRIADMEDSVETIGDESLLLFKQFGNEVVVSVGENRALSIPQILVNQPENDVILLDDAFQHRSVKPSLSIMLTTYQIPFYDDFVMPAGKLRESRSGARRADIIIMTKCPKDLSISEQHELSNKLKIHNSSCNTFFTSIKYRDLKPIGANTAKKSQVVALAGIANPNQFFNDVSGIFDVRETLAFRDHHTYSLKNVNKIISLLKEYNAMLVCTEKDAIKLKNFEDLINYPCYSLPMEMWLLADEDQFIKRLDKSIQEYNREISN